jgi:hypothetical protein
MHGFGIKSVGSQLSEPSERNVLYSRSKVPSLGSSEQIRRRTNKYSPNSCPYRSMANIKSLYSNSSITTWGAPVLDWAFSPMTKEIHPLGCRATSFAKEHVHSSTEPNGQGYQHIVTVDTGIMSI